MPTVFFQQHKQLLDDALAAIETRGFYSAYPEVPSGRVYGENAKKDGIATFEGYKGAKFSLNQYENGSTIGNEQSPYGFEIDTQYPDVDIEVLIQHVQEACPAWRNASIETRVGCALEILHRLNKRSFEIACTVMHTTGQGFMMAFQAGGPHAQHREMLRLLLIVGVLGGFTTFSTFALDSIELFEDGRLWQVTLYIVLSNVIGILAALGLYRVGTILFQSTPA